jgi:hypothetical protein
MTIQQNFVNIKPSLNLDFANTKQLDPRITFARASTARFYDGKTTAKAEENLVTQSQGFTVSPWEGPAAITANSAVAPDGTTTAALVTGTNTTDYKQQKQQLASQLQGRTDNAVYSAILKKGNVEDKRYRFF